MKVIGKALLVLCILLAGVALAEGTAYTPPEQISDYLYYMEYSDYIPELAGYETEVDISGGCSSVRNGAFFGRNLDLSYCDIPEFVIRMSGSDTRFASIGISANPYISTSVDEMTEDELMRIPFNTLDGINENGVIASVHVVICGDIDDMSGTNPGAEQIDAIYVVRFILDNAESAEHAVELLQSADIVGGFDGYGLHWMIADESDTYIVEMIGNRLVASRNQYTCMTNFYMNLGEPVPEQTAAGVVFADLPLLNDHAMGIERYCYLRDHYDEAYTAEGMAQLMQAVKATRPYEFDVRDTWFTEYITDETTIYDSREDFIAAAEEQLSLYRERDRKDPKGDWITWHTSVYDINARSLTLYSQEAFDTAYAFNL